METGITYTPREQLEIRGSLIFIAILIVCNIIASLFQYFANVKPVIILGSLVPYGIAAFLAYLIYRRLKERRSAVVLQWIVAFITCSMIVLARYNYALNISWRYAAEALHMYGISLVMLVTLQFLYNKKLFLFFFAFTVINWGVFLYAAHLHGLSMPFLGIVEGQPVYGPLISRQLYMLLMLSIVAFAAYRNIPVINRFDEMTQRQHALIREKSKEQLELAHEIISRMMGLFREVEKENRELELFNDRLQSQAASFEEMSATIEELTGSSEQIAEVADRQVRFGDDIDFSMKEYLEIKGSTEEKLQASLTEIQEAVTQTNYSSRFLSEIEDTINDICRQSEAMDSTVSEIMNISDQINMLSLNASIEAARAGEHGLGFAVVASEVGKLATETSNSIKKIETVLKANSEKTHRGVKIIQQASNTIKHMMDTIISSSGRIDELRDSIFLEEKFLAGINNQMKKNFDLSRIVGDGTEEQKQALEASTRSVDNLNEELAAMVEGIAAISDSAKVIMDQAGELVLMARKYDLHEPDEEKNDMEKAVGYSETSGSDNTKDSLPAINQSVIHINLP